MVLENNLITKVIPIFTFPLHISGWVTAQKHNWVIVTIEPDEDNFTVEVGSGVKRSELSEFMFYLKERMVKKFLRLYYILSSAD